MLRELTASSDQLGACDMRLEGSPARADGEGFQTEGGGGLGYSKVQVSTRSFLSSRAVFAANGFLSDAGDMWKK